MRAVRLTVADLDAFLARIDYVRAHRDAHRRGLSVGIDDEGVKLKLDATWSPGIGEAAADDAAKRIADLEQELRVVRLRAESAEAIARAHGARIGGPTR